MSPERGWSEDVGITNGDTGFSLGYLGPTLVLWPLDIRISLKLIQVLTDTKLSSIQVLHWLLNEHVKYVLALLAFMLVSLLPVYTDEGYIPFFPDFLELDWIGLRGLQKLNIIHLLTPYSEYPPYFPSLFWQDYYG